MSITVTDVEETQKKLNRNFCNSIAQRSKCKGESHIFNTTAGFYKLVKKNCGELFPDQLVEVQFSEGKFIGKYVGVIETKENPVFVVLGRDKLFVPENLKQIKKI